MPRLYVEIIFIGEGPCRPWGSLVCTRDEAHKICECFGDVACHVSTSKIIFDGKIPGVRRGPLVALGMKYTEFVNVWRCGVPGVYVEIIF
jgi:hypothetical protein